VPARPGVHFVKGAGWVDLDRHVAEGQRDDGVRFKATTDPDTHLTVVEHADGRQDAIARPRTVRVRLGHASGGATRQVTLNADGHTVATSHCNCCNKPHDLCSRRQRGR
jgi:hypothetical protein